MESVQLPNNLFLEEVRYQLKQGHTVTFRVKGWSMRPFLENARDKVLLGPVDREIKVGDVALILANDGRYILHRVVAIDKEGNCTLWGDGNVVGRETCTSDNVIGLARGFYRGKKEKYFDCQGKTWQRYSAFWIGVSSYRRYFLFIARILFKLHLL